jgi:hypothetical protein
MPQTVIDHLNSFTPIELVKKSKVDMRLYVGYRENELNDIDESDEIDDIVGIRNVFSDPPQKMTGDGAGSIIEIEPEHGSNQELSVSPADGVTSNDLNVQSTMDRRSSEKILVEENLVEDSVSIPNDNEGIVPHGHLTRSHFKYPKDSHLW